ncbi:hypothetical protein D3C84_1123910 [compost metagenome]
MPPGASAKVAVTNEILVHLEMRNAQSMVVPTRLIELNKPTIKIRAAPINIF